MSSQDPTDPRWIQKFTDIDHIEEKLVDGFLKRYPDLRAMIVQKTNNPVENEVFVEVTILMPGGELITHAATIPTFVVKPLNQQST